MPRLDDPSLTTDNGFFDIKDVPRPKRFVDALESYLNGAILPKYIAAGKSLNRETLEALRLDVGAAIGAIVRKASFETADDMLAWLSDQYFLAVNVNGMRLDQLPGVAASFTSNADLGRVPLPCLRLYRDIFRDTDIGDKIDEEIKRR